MRLVNPMNDILPEQVNDGMLPEPLEKCSETDCSCSCHLRSKSQNSVSDIDFDAELKERDINFYLLTAFHFGREEANKVFNRVGWTIYPEVHETTYEEYRHQKDLKLLSSRLNQNEQPNYLLTPTSLANMVNFGCYHLYIHFPDLLTVVSTSLIIFYAVDNKTICRYYQVFSTIDGK